MDISGINNNMINNTIDNAKAKANNTTDDDFEARLQKAFTDKDKQALKKTCQDFESIMMGMMYKEMKATVPKSDLLSEDSGKDIFDSMLDDNLMQSASQGQGVGLADMMFKQLSKQMDSVYKTNNNVPADATDKGTDKTGDKGDTEEVERSK